MTMRHQLGITLLLVAMSSAHASSAVESILAQCTIDSYSETGRQFLKENASRTDQDSAYRNWMMLCMKAKGFAYNLKRCPPSKDAATQASEARCYEKM